MATYDTLEEALKFVEQCVSASVGTLKKELKEEQLVQARNLYNAYSPRTNYKRRYTLLNSSNFHVTTSRSGNVWNLEGESFVTGRSGNRLDETLSRGNAPHWRGKVPARPWLKWTEQEFKAIAEEIVRQSLITQGIL